MVSSSASTVTKYLAELPEDRKKAIKSLVKLIDGSIPDGFTKEMRWGMIVYSVPLEVSGPTYNKQPLACVALASQKNYISVYLMSVYSSKATTREFERLWKQGGRKLDMGKACVRFKSLDDANLDAIAWAVSLLDPVGFTQMYLKARK